MLPNVSPKIFSFSAVIVGYILIDDLTANEQNALGNWLMLVAQVLSTNAFYRAVMQERGLEKKGVTETGRNNAYSFPNYSGTKDEKKETVNMLKKMIKALEKEINNINKN